MTQVAAPAAADRVAVRTTAAEPVAPPLLPAPARRPVALPRGVNAATDAVAVALGIVVVAVTAGPVQVATAATLAVLWPALVAAAGAHRLRGVAGTRPDRVARVARAGALLGLGCWAVDTLGSLSEPPSVLLSLTALLTAFSAVGCLVPVGAGQRTTRLLVAGRGDDVAQVLRELQARPGTFEAVAVCSTTGPGAPLPVDLPTVTGLGSVPEAAAQHRADAVLVLPSGDVSARDVQRLGWWLEGSGVQLYVDTGLLDLAPSRAVLARAGGLRLLHVRTEPAGGVAHALKAVVERAAAAVALVLLSPVLLAIAAAVRIDSPGPALFRQERVGRNGRPFTIVKYRTMRTTAEAEVQELAPRNEAAGVLFKIRDDPRVTRVGGVLRRYSIDELPQLVNVVRGEMALVGPRPALAEEVAQYTTDPRRRLVVKPGITGLWQVSGRSDLSWEETVRLDLAYVDNWSLTLDARILLRTVGAVVSHRGAY